MAVVVAACIALWIFVFRSEEDTRPNVLFILADDMGFSDAGCYGGEINTPNIDRLAKGGLLFTQHYSTGRCWPSRASILTGYYPQQVQRDSVLDIKLGKRPAWAQLLPELLKPYDYKSYIPASGTLTASPRIMASTEASGIGISETGEGMSTRARTPTVTSPRPAGKKMISSEMSPRVRNTTPRSPSRTTPLPV